MTLPRNTAAAVGLALGYVVDAVVGDPRRRHPVAGFGRLAGWLETRTYADRRLSGVVHLALLASATAGLGVLLERLGRRSTPVMVMVTAAATWTVLGGRSLSREATIVAGQLAADQLEAARMRVRNLVGRETAELSEEEVARATVESVAENTSDAMVAPLLWGAVFGVPGLLVYRAINTLDAMVGHHSPRYEHFGWASARLDDVVNWGPARVAGLVTAACAPLVGGSTRGALMIIRRDAGQHPSPNAGVVEAAFAGSLGIRLGGRNVYGERVEDRGVLGDGHPVLISDVRRANRLATAVSAGSLVLAMIIRGVGR